MRHSLAILALLLAPGLLAAGGEENVRCYQLAPGIHAPIYVAGDDGEPAVPSKAQLDKMLAKTRKRLSITEPKTVKKGDGSTIAHLWGEPGSFKRGQKAVTVTDGTTTFEIINVDGSGEGLNDPSSVSPVGGNSGTTLGQQRLNSIAFAAENWVELIDSSVTVEVEVSFDPLQCNGTSAVLGSAGPRSVARDFTNAPIANTWHPIALANSIAEEDLDAASADIDSRFNSAIDDGCLNGISGWYYGLDGEEASGELDFTTTIIHEIAHGLGFTTLVDLSSGQRQGGRNDVFMLNLFDESEGTTWESLSDSERASSATNTGNLTWEGTNAKNTELLLSDGRNPSSDRPEMHAPGSLQQGSSVAHWGNSFTPDELMEPIIRDAPRQDYTNNLMKDIGWTLQQPQTAAERWSVW